MQLFLKRCKPIAKVVLFFAVWQFLQLYNLAYAFADTPKRNTAAQSSPSLVKNDFGQKLDNTQALLKQLAEDIDKGRPFSSNLEKVKGFRAQIDKEHDDVVKYFAAVRRHLEEKGLAQEILDRHDKTVESYSAKHKELIKKFENIQATKAENLKPVLSQAMEFLQANSHQKKQIALDPENLPHGMPKIKERKPRTTLEEFRTDNITAPTAHTATIIKTVATQTAKANTMAASLARAAAGINTVATQAASAAVDPDLAETIEVKFTQSIRDLATQLEHNPLKIFNWVRNNIEFVPTYGSIQGAEMCLMTKQGNAFDTASLLIALLRVSNVHARYVYGTVEIPIDKAMNWAGGVTSPNVAVQIFASCGIPTRFGYKGSQIVSIQIEHIWVEAYIDYSPSRGATHVQGDTWIPMDASFKQYVYTAGIDLEQAVPFNAENFAQQINASATINENEHWATGLNFGLIQTTLDNYFQQQQDYMRTTTPNATISDVVGKKEIIKYVFPFFPATLPNKLIIGMEKFTEVPACLRHSITFTLTQDFTGESADFTISKPLSELAGKKITLSYTPATQKDWDIINSLMPHPDQNGNVDINQLPKSYPAYLIHFKPEFRIDGVVVASGSSIVMGCEEQFDMSFYNPAGIGDNVITNIVISGEYYGIAFDLQGIPNEQLEISKACMGAVKQEIENKSFTALNKERTIGEMLYGTAIGYFAELDSLNKALSRRMGIISQRFVSEGMFSAVLNVQYAFGSIPISASPAGFSMDIDNDHYFAISKNGDLAQRNKYGLLSGITSSQLEHAIPENLFSTSENTVEGVSAVKILAIASQEGIPVYTINKGNINNIMPQLQLDGAVKTDIMNAVNSGKVVTTSKTNITTHGWAGCGYIIIDPVNGAGSYMISGGKNGSALWWALTAAIYTCYFLEGAGIAAGFVLFDCVLGPFIAGLGSLLSGLYFEICIYIGSYSAAYLSETILSLAAGYFWYCFNLTGAPGSMPDENTQLCTLMLLFFFIGQEYIKFYGR